MNVFSYGIPLLTTLILLYYDKLGVTDIFTCWVKHDPNSNNNI